MDIRVLIAAHKKTDLPKDPLYLPIQVNAKGKESFLDTHDDTGDNISDLNPYFSELTALYWAWKNLDADYVGLCHYRRYFGLHKGDSLEDVLTLSDAEKLFNGSIMILPKKRHYYIESLYSHYVHTFDESHLIKTKEILSSLHPEYLPSFEKALSERSGYMFNMYITKKEISDSYCEWLFPILFELYDSIDSSSMTDFEKRYIGRISERLFNVWLHYQITEGSIKKEAVKELPYVYIGKEPWVRKISSFLQAKLMGKKYKGSF